MITVLELRVHQSLNRPMMRNEMQIRVRKSPIARFPPYLHRICRNKGLADACLGDP